MHTNAFHGRKQWTMPFLFVLFLELQTVQHCWCIVCHVFYVCLFFFPQDSKVKKCRPQQSKAVFCHLQQCHCHHHGLPLPAYTRCTILWQPHFIRHLWHKLLYTPARLTNRLTCWKQHCCQHIDLTFHHGVSVGFSDSFTMTWNNSTIVRGLSAWDFQTCLLWRKNNFCMVPFSTLSVASLRQVHRSTFVRGLLAWHFQTHSPWHETTFPWCHFPHWTWHPWDKFTAAPLWGVC